MLSLAYKTCSGSARVTEMWLVNEAPGAEQALCRQFLRKPALRVGLMSFPAGREGQRPWPGSGRAACSHCYGAG